MTERRAVVASRLGLHARASARLVRTANSFLSKITLQHAVTGRRVDAKSIFGVMMLAATEGTAIIVTTTGADELAAADAVAREIEEPDGGSI